MSVNFYTSVIRDLNSLDYISSISPWFKCQLPKSIVPFRFKDSKIYICVGRKFIFLRNYFKEFSVQIAYHIVEKGMDTIWLHIAAYEFSLFYCSK